MSSRDWTLSREPAYFLIHLRELARRIQASVIDATRSRSYDELAGATDTRGGDVIYGLDLHAEDVLLEFCRSWGHDMAFVLVAEGIESGRRIFPDGADEEKVQFTLVVDPVDGTRGLMYGKRSAWTLLAVAPPSPVGESAVLSDVQVALQTELPTARAALADTLWTIVGARVHAETVVLATGESRAFTPRPSSAESIAGGFATISKFFPGTKAVAAELEEALFGEVLGPPGDTPQVFDDEYICTGGQLYELAVGRDRFVADLRPILAPSHAPVRPLCCHPYDICTSLIVQEAGIILTDGWRRPLDTPLDTESPVSWIGYANRAIQASIEPVLLRLLRERAPNR